MDELNEYIRANELSKSLQMRLIDHYSEAQVGRGPRIRSERKERDAV
jgi:hypothetical protein